jgi:hypothetical protein
MAKTVEEFSSTLSHAPKDELQALRKANLATDRAISEHITPVATDQLHD